MENRDVLADAPALAGPLELKALWVADVVQEEDTPPDGADKRVVVGDRAEDEAVPMAPVRLAKF